jgi:DNA-binding NarL/FixJ family response regulator
VLVVEPDWLSATQIRRALDPMHLDLEVVSRGGEALLAIERQPPSLVIVGFEECRQALDIAKTAAVPAVFVTSNQCESMLRDALRLEPRAIVLKPFTPEQLRVAVELALSNSSDTRADSARKTLAKIAALLADEQTLSTTLEPQLLEPLSPREREIMHSLLAHERVPSMASRLRISENTVRNHLKAIYRKVGVHSQAELLDVALGRRRPSVSMTGPIAQKTARRV